MRLVLCNRGTLGKGTLHTYPPYRVPRSHCAFLPYCFGIGEYGQCSGRRGDAQLFGDVSQHEDIDGAFIVVPFEAYAAKQIASSVLHMCMFAFQTFDVVLNVNIGKFDIKCYPGKEKLWDYQSKHHIGTHHTAVRQSGIYTN
jgi:hypothetical protein